MTVKQDRDVDTLVDIEVPDPVDPRRRPPLPLILCLIAAVVFAGYSAVMHFGVHAQYQRIAHVRAGAAGEIGALTATILSYSPDTVEADVETAKSHLSGDFLTTFGDLSSREIVPKAKQDAVSAQWEVTGASLVSADEDSAAVLVLLHGTVTSLAAPEPEQLISSVRVRADRVGDSWSISGLEPL
jgi:Mce-associated membrane protein